MATANAAALTLEQGRALYVRLVDLRNEAGAKLYHRLCLARDLLTSHEWVEDLAGGGGDESIAIDRLEDTCFADLCGAVSLPDLLEVLRRVPAEKTWKANKYNLRRMWAEMKARAKGAAPPRPRQERIEGEDARDRLIRRLREECTELKEAIRTLTKENLALKRAVRRVQEQMKGVPI